MENNVVLVKNIIFICTTVIIFVGLLIVFHYYHLSVKENQGELLQVITMEGLEMQDLSANKVKIEHLYKKKMDDILSDKFLKFDLADDFCKKFDGSSLELEKACERLTPDNCNKTACCVFLNGKKCVAGTAKGPVFQTTPEGAAIPVDYYYYQYKKFMRRGQLNTSSSSSSSIDASNNENRRCRVVCN